MTDLIDVGVRYLLAFHLLMKCGWQLAYTFAQDPKAVAAQQVEWITSGDRATAPGRVVSLLFAVLFFYGCYVVLP